MPGHFSIGLLYFLVSLLKLILPHRTTQFPLELVTTGIVLQNGSHESCDSVFTISVVSRETVSSASDVMSLLTVDDSSVNDSSTRRLLFFGENLADGGGLFRGEVRHASFKGTGVM